MPGDPHNGSRPDEAVSSSSTDTKPNSEIDTAVLHLDIVFTALSHPHRRYLLYALFLKPERELHALAELIVEWELGEDASVVGQTRKDDVVVGLFHSHIPRLVEFGVAEFGVAEFDFETMQITRSARAELAIDVLGAISNTVSTAELSAWRDSDGTNADSGVE